MSGTRPEYLLPGPNLTTTLRRWYLWAALCFVPTLFFHYVGEEGVFTLNALEMWQRGEYLRTVMYGAPDGGGNGRPPLFNWLIIPLAQLLGWPQMLLASRLVTVAATLATSVTVGWLARQLWHDRNVTWMAALLYLVTADVLLYRGWLAYADPLLALFVVMAVALTWAACLRKSYSLLAAAMLAVFAAMLTKALTAYVFWLTCVLVLGSAHQHRRFLLAPRAWLCYALGAALPALWFALGTRNPEQPARLVGDMLVRLTFTGWGDYFTHLLSYPVEMGARLLPGTFFAALIVWQGRRHPGRAAAALPDAARLSLWMALLCIAPYWLAPSGGPRYVLPIYALLVLPMAYGAVHLVPLAHVRRWVIGLLTLATVLNLLIYPYYQRAVRGANYAQMAQQIVQRYGSWPIYATNVTSVGLSVVAHINTLRWPQPAVIWPPADLADGIVIARDISDFPGQSLSTLKIDSDSVLLLCRGPACAAGGTGSTTPAPRL